MRLLFALALLILALLLVAFLLLVRPVWAATRDTTSEEPTLDRLQMVEAGGSPAPPPAPSPPPVAPCPPEPTWLYTALNTIAQRSVERRNLVKKGEAHDRLDADPQRGVGAVPGDLGSCRGLGLTLVCSPSPRRETAQP